MTYIIHPTATGVAITTPTGEVPIEQVAQQVAPDGIYTIVTADQIPSDRTFRNAWSYGNKKIEINLDKAKEIAQNIRRTKRSEEFAPLDQAIAYRLPNTTIKDSEEKRKEIREKYKEIQNQIDAAKNIEEIKIALQFTQATIEQ